jgi:Flp pilus assembly protein TadD
MKQTGLVLAAMLIISGTGWASYDKALELYQKKQYAESLKMCADDLTTGNDFSENSQNYKLRYLAAHNHWKLGNKEPVVQHFRRCMDIKKNEVNPYIDLAIFFMETSRMGDAESSAQNGLRIKQDPMLFYMIGKVSLLKGNFWRAKEYFEKTNAMTQEFYFCYNSLGIALMNLNKFSEANTAFTVASALYPDSPQIMNNLGMSYEMLTKYDRARECFEKAILLDKGNKTIQENLQRIKSKSAK